MPKKMSKERSSGHKAGSKGTPSIGITLGGGGPMGGVYEIGALRAIDEVFEGLDLNRLDHYVGVNVGAFVAANLANQITPAQMCRIFVRNEADIHPFHPGVFYYPAVKEYLERAKAVPGLVASAVMSLVKKPSDQSLLEYLTVMSQAVPVGIFDNQGFHDYVARAFSSLGRTNDFNLLSRNLRIIATDAESGETVRFGDPELASIPISKAIQASMASPGLYVPVEYEDRYFMDGTLNKGLHSSVALESGCDIMLAINPVVPVGVASPESGSRIELRQKILKSGMGNVLSQSYRTMVHSRLVAGLKNIRQTYPEKDLFLFEPSKVQARMFLSSVFSFEARKRVCEQAYQATRSSLREQIGPLSKALAPAGITVRTDILEDSSRTLSDGLYGPSMPVYPSAVTPMPVPNRDKPSSAVAAIERVGQKVAAWF